MADLAEIAIWLARRGWAVYPQAPLTNTPRGNCANCKARKCDGPAGGCPCLVSATTPCHALHSASADPAIAAARWEHAPRCNPALHLGKSGLAVLDLDCHGEEAPAELAPGLSNPGVSNGLGAFAALLDHLGVDWPTDTLIVESPGGGLHIYYLAPRIQLRHCYAAWQVEVKAGACSITAPGSVRKLEDGSTGTYRRISDAVNPAPFPRWLGEWLVQLGRVADPSSQSRALPTMPSRHSRFGNHSARWWERAWHDQLAEIANADPGTRNDVVLRRGLRLFNLAAEAECPWTADDAERALIEAQHQYAANAGRPANQAEYRAVAEATRRRASGGRRSAA